jgi:hypothetical protein
MERVDGFFTKKFFCRIPNICIAKWRYHFPQFKDIVSAYYLSTFRSIPKGFFHLLNKCFTADSNALRPLVFFITR